MTKVMTSRGLVAALAATVLGLVLAFGVATTTHAASVSSLSVGSATVAPGASVTVDVTATADGMGSYGLNISYDSTLVSVSACTSTNGVCNKDFGASTIRMNGSNLSGITGTGVVLGTITFVAGNTEGVADVTFDTADVSDTTGAALTVTPTDGTITIAAATATPTLAPTASPTAAPSATPTPKSLPSTGGPAGDSTSSSLTLLLAAAGLVVVAGSAWAVARVRRED